MTALPGSIATSPAGRAAAGLSADVRRLQLAGMASNTRSAYRSDWHHFATWCAACGLESLPSTVDTVCEYLGSTSGMVDPAGEWLYAPSTLARRVAAIAKIHRLAGITTPTDHPAVAATLAGIRRQRVRPLHRVAPLLLDDLRSVLARVECKRFPAAVIGRRDTALLLFGFAGAFRRSELASLRVGDVTADIRDGLHVRLRRSKTDQEGRGATNALPYGSHAETCAPCAWARWIDVLAAYEVDGRRGVLRELFNGRSDEGEHICGSAPSMNSLDPDSPLFRPVHKSGSPGAGPITGHAVNAVIKRRVAAAGLDPARFGGHSLRAGFVTEAVRAGADAASIMRQTGHRSVAMVEVYRRENAPLIGNAVTRLGL